MILLPENYYLNCLCRRESRCRPEVFGRKEDGKCEPPAKKAAENKCPPAKVKPGAKSSCPSKPEPVPQQQQPSSCGCGRRNAGKSKRPPRSRNPFIIFYLTMYRKQPGRKITDVAREAGKLWCGMSPEDKEVYRKMARLEQKRRQRKSRRRRHKCRR
ncbi:protamine-like [Nasonia vitripennis]|uniref:HMG box domain-containing protein n=1 Tax=Nasonia vitripennis TaxID=7425 RepID=A0A7M7H6T0_NASVI|nr:protamine-like [Nasonia vitripennis]